MPEIRIKHSDITNPQTITQVMEREFEKRGWDLHRHEVEKLEDDFHTGERVLKVKTKRYFVMGS